MKGNVFTTPFPAKHQPATPLPWYTPALSGKLYDGRGHSSPLACDGVIGVMTTKNQAGDADYAIHASNAYPKLVGALRHLLAASRATCPTVEAITEAKALAAHVLRELGEVS